MNDVTVVCTHVAHQLVPNRLETTKLFTSSVFDASITRLLFSLREKQ